MKLLLNPEYGLYEKGGQVFCDSLQVAKGLKKRHDHVLRDIESKLEDISKSNLPKFGEINFNYDYYKDEKNRKQPRYLLTKDGFVFLISSYGGVEATNFKIAYITRFNEMEAFIKSLQTAKLEFPAFTNAIMEAHEEPNITIYYALHAALYAYLLKVDMVYMVASFLRDSDYYEPENYKPDIYNTTVSPFEVSIHFPDFYSKINFAIDWWKKHVLQGISPEFDEKRDAEILKELRRVL